MKISMIVIGTLMAAQLAACSDDESASQATTPAAAPTGVPVAKDANDNGTPSPFEQILILAATESRSNSTIKHPAERPTVQVQGIDADKNLQTICDYAIKLKSTIADVPFKLVTMKDGAEATSLTCATQK